MATHEAHRHEAGHVPVKRRTALVLAEFTTTAAVVHAAEKVRDAGFTRWDTHTPFPIHGMDRAMGLKDSKLGWIVLACALTGLTGAFTMMYWMNGIDYRLVIGGKPPATIPSMVPIMFELTILLSAFGAVLGMFGLNKLPRHNHPVFESDRFRSFSDDKFFLSIEAEDPKFNVSKCKSLLESAHASFIEVIEEDE
jgi:hypothetical protein